MILTSPAADIDVPRENLAEHVLAGCGRWADKPAILDGLTGMGLTYRELDTRSRHAALALAETVGPGDSVALISHNQPDYAVALFGILRAGAAVAPMNPLLTVDELVGQLRNSRARAVITSVPAADKALAAADRLNIGVVYVLGEHAGCRPFDQLLDEVGDGGALPLIDPCDTIAVLPHSSGTSGQAKGVMLTHHNLVANLEQLRPVYRINTEDVFCAVLPLFHMYGLTIVLNAALRAGATVVTMPRFDPRQYLEIMQRHGVTRAHLTPPIVAVLAADPCVADFDLSSLRFAMSGAAPLDQASAGQAEERIGCAIRQGYGMTEAGPGTHIAFDDEFAATPAGSVGRLMPNTQGRIVDPATGQDTDPAGGGELWVRGPQIMRGYLGDAGKTAQNLAGGWLRTGDLVRVDKEGFFWVTDRLKDLIKYKGYQVAPAELEAVLRTHPSVLDAAVVAMPHPTGGEAPRAFVVTSGHVDAAALMDWFGQRVAPYKRIRAIEFVDELPKSPSGKILRRLLGRLDD